MGMKSEEEAVALQAIEFWTSVAEEESNLESDYLDAQEVRHTVFHLLSPVIRVSHSSPGPP
jgi:hypothetical protein